MLVPLHIFDPRRNLQLQGFAGRAATTTIHDGTETGVSISGIFQAAEDFAVLGWWNAYDYFNHLRMKHLPKTDLSGLKLELDHDPRCYRDWCVHLGDLPGRRGLRRVGLVERLRLLQPPPDEAPAEDRPLRQVLHPEVVEV